MRRLNKEMEVQSQVSDSTFTVDIDRVSNDGKKMDSEGICFCQSINFSIP